MDFSQPPFRRRSFLFGAASLIGSAGIPAVAAEPWPTRPVRLVVPFPPGGPTDIISRLVAARLSEILGQQFLVENRPGANGVIGTEAVSRAKPDGYTLLLSASGPLASGLPLYKNLNYDVLRDFVSISPVAVSSIVLVGSRNFAPRTLADTIAAAKAKPKSVKAELNTVGSMHHLLTELLRVRNGLDLVQVPYKGSAPAIVDLVAGHVDIGFESLPGVLDLIRAGRLTPFAVASKQRLDALPEVPTFTELGMPEFVAEPWFAIVAPKAVPAAVVDALSKALHTVLRSPDTAAQFDKQGMSPTWMSTADADRFLKQEVSRWAAIVKEAGTTSE